MRTLAEEACTWHATRGSGLIPTAKNNRTGGARWAGPGGTPKPAAETATLPHTHRSPERLSHLFMEDGMRERASLLQFEVDGGRGVW